MVSWITQWLERSKHGPGLDHQCPTLATSCSPAAELVVGLPQAFPPELTRILASDAAHPSATGAASGAACPLVHPTMVQLRRCAFAAETRW